MQNKLIRNSSFRLLIFAIIIPVILEVFFFNYRFWQSLCFENSDTYTVSVVDDMLVIDNINVNVGNVYLDVGNEGDVIPFCLRVTDSASTDVDYAYSQVCNSVLESKYASVHTDGIVRTIKIVFNPALDGVHSFDLDNAHVAVNVTRPFLFRPIRFVFLLFVVSLIILFRPGSKIYSIKLFEKTTINRGVICLSVILMCFIWIIIISCYHDIPIKAYYDHIHVEAIYSYYADALLDGHTYLNIEVPDFLKEMDNPYDTNLRGIIGKELGESIPTDFAYFDGHYYCYYGVVPVLLFYVPFVALTGEPLRNSVPVFICGIVLIISSFRLVYVMLKKYQKLSLGHYL